MRILFPTALDLSTESGPVLHALSVAEAWRRAGHDVRVLGSRANVDRDGLVTGMVSAGQALPSGRQVRRWISRSVRDEVAAEGVELLYMRGAFPAAARIAKTAGVLVVAEVNGALAVELGVSGASLPVRFIQLRREALIFKFADGLVAVSQVTANYVEKRCSGSRAKLRVIPNGCEVERFAQASLPGKNRVASSLVFVGGIHPWTRLELVIGALPEVQDATLTVIGDGKRLDELKQLAVSFGVSDRVNFFGRLPHSEIPGHMARHGIGLGNLEPDGVDAGAALKVSEYLAAGLCPITRANQSLEQIESKQLGVLLHGPVTSHSLAESLRSAIRRSELFTPEAVERRVEYARTHLSWDATARKILEFAEELRP